MATDLGALEPSWFGLDPLEARTLASVEAADAPAPLYVAPAGAQVRFTITTDVNSDGHQDLVVGAADTVAVLRGRGDGTFRPPLISRLDTRPHQDAVVNLLRLRAGDYDGDGDTDLVAAGTLLGGPTGFFGERTWLLVNSGSGRMNPGGVTGDILALYNHGRVAQVDLNGDGDLELLTDDLTVYDFVSEFTDRRLRRDGRLARGLPENARAVGRADLDGDGDADWIAGAIAADGLSTDLLLLRNEGAGDYARVALGRTDGAVSLRDVDGDSLPDLIASSTTYSSDGPAARLSVRRNLGGSFAETATLYQEAWPSVRARGGHGPTVPERHGYAASLAIDAVGDVGGDARPDVVVAIRSEQYWAYRPTGGPTSAFSEVYRVALVATGPGTQGALPSYAAEPFSGEPSPADLPPDESGAGDRVRDFDGDGLADRVDVRGLVRGPNSVWRVGQGVYVELGSAPRPKLHALSLSKNERTVRHGVAVGPGDALRATVRTGAAARTAAAFLDSNANGVLDRGDRRVLLRRLATDRAGPSVALTLRPKASWGRGLQGLFLIVAGADGRASAPLVSYLTLR